jgi:ABC-type transporter Mla maintaining outer membrane lipid asymmetry ATPase subunit MlaF
MPSAASGGMRKQFGETARTLLLKPNYSLLNYSGLDTLLQEK